MLERTAIRAPFLPTLVGLLLSAASGPAQAITVDGLVGDWGVSGLTNDIADYSGVVGTPWETTAFEGDGFTTPGSGGQDYDLEFMAAYVDGNTLYGIVLSGQRADNGFANYSPGDVFFTAYDANLASEVLFGLEVDGYTYDLLSNGHTGGVGSAFYAAGQLVRAPGVEAGVPFGDPNTGGSPSVQIVDPMGSTVSLGAIDAYIFNQADALGQHSVIEFAIDLAQFELGNGGHITGMVWAPGCGNDHGITTPPIPEPGAKLLFCAGLFTVCATRRWHLRS